MGSSRVDNDGAISYRSQRGGDILALVGALVIAGIAARLLIGDSIAGRVVGASGLMVAGPFVVLLTGAVIRHPVILRIAPTGIAIKTPMAPFSPPEILWSEISRLVIFRWGLIPGIATKRTLGIVPVDPSWARWKRPVARMNTRLSGVPIVLFEGWISADLNEVVETMRSMAPELDLEHGRPRSLLGSRERPTSREN